MFHIVDDNLIGAKNTAKIINLFDEQSQVFISAVSYLDYLKSDGYEKPSAIFTDVLMYKMNGYELMKEVLAIHPDQKFVVISGRPDMKDPYKNRACFYLGKPFYIRDIEKILYEVRRCEQEGPSAEADCANICDSSQFALSGWKCPHTAKPKNGKAKKALAHRKA